MTKPKLRTLAVFYSRYSPRPEPSDDGKPLSTRSKRQKEKAAEDRKLNSCDKQIEYGREYCARMGYELREELIFRDDALSGKSMKKRTGLRDALAACKRGMIFITRDVKRAARDRLDTLLIIRGLLRRGAIFETLVDGRYDATDVNKVMVFGIKAVMAECERMSISKDTQAKMLRHQANGRRMSAIPPYGKRIDPEDDSRLIDAEEEQPILEQILEFRRAGQGSTNIATELNARGEVDAAWLNRGRRWYPNTVERIALRALQQQEIGV